MKIKDISSLDNSIQSFEFIKEASEKYWQTIILKDCWGLQIQEGSRWRKGLTTSEINEFQSILGITFPESLKNFYSTMNGIDKPAIDLLGGESAPVLSSSFYSFPEDINLIIKKISQVYEDNDPENMPRVFPYLGHRYLTLNHTESVISIWGDETIYWAENLAKGITRDIFDLF
jgi:hypothetical protein